MTKTKRQLRAEAVERLEEWKPVVGYEGLYEISNRGRVRSLGKRVRCKRNGRWFQRTTKGKILKPSIANGYKRVSLYSQNGRLKTVSVHRLVAEAFIENRNNKAFVNHIDGVKTNNNVENLEWCTASENNYHAYRTGLIHIPERDMDSLRELSKAKCSRPVIRDDGVSYKSVRDAERAAGACNGTLAKVIRRNGTMFGHRYQYADEKVAL